MADAGKKPRNSIASFRVNHIPEVKIPHRIREGLAKMKEAGDAWLYQNDFARLSGVQPVDLNTYHVDFKDQIYETGGSKSKVVWFVTPAAKREALGTPESKAAKKV